MKPHEIVKDYKGHPNFGDICKSASEYARVGYVDEVILRLIATTYGAVPKKLEMLQNARPLEIFGRDLIEESALEQMYTAMKVPVAVRGALMPDAHLGYALPIGGVWVTNNAISPSAVGFDISCMMHFTVLDITPEDFEKRVDLFTRVLRNVTSFGVGSDFDTGLREHEVMDESNWNISTKVRSFRSLAQKQLGSSGGGNHFADIVLTEFGNVGLLTHSGSRGTGHKLATHYIKLAEEYTSRIARGVPKEYSWLSLDTEEGKEYQSAMRLMGQYALANHELIHDHFLEQSGLQAVGTIWNRHNYAWSNPAGQVIHRKGATPADIGIVGIIPGTCATPAYVVEGVGNPKSISSASHGAGRLRSRKDSEKIFKKDVFVETMKKNGVDFYGVAPDESPHAYKNIEDVMYVQEGVTVNILEKLYPRVVIMGGEADDGD